MKSMLSSLCLLLAMLMVYSVPANSSEADDYAARLRGGDERSIAHLRDRNEKRIKEITKYIAAEAKKQQDAWVIAKRAQDAAKATQNNNNNHGGPGMGPGMAGGTQPDTPAIDTPIVPDKFEINEELIQAAVTQKFGGNLMDATGLFPKVDIRSKIDLEEAAAKLPEIKARFEDSYEMYYEIEPLSKKEAAEAQDILKKATTPETKLLQLQFKNKSGQWVEWTLLNAESSSYEWRIAIRFEPVTPEAIYKVEQALAEIEYPLYHENDPVEISFSPTERVARRTYQGAFKRIGRFKIVIGKDILAMDDLPKKLRVRFNPDMNRAARAEMIDRHPIFARNSMERGELITEKVKEMLARQLEQNLARGWIYIGDSWKTPADMVHDVLVFRRQHDAATRAAYKQQIQRQQQQDQEEDMDGGRGGYRRH